MFFSILQGPRCRIHTLVNFWSGNFHSRTRTYSTSSNLHGSIINGLEGGRSKKWTRRPVTTKTEERNKAIRSSKTSSIRHEILDGTVATSATLNVNKTEISQFQKIQHSDIEKTIAENKDLASLVTTFVFDFETTGFSREKDRIIEFALQDLQGGENSTFQTLVNPDCYVPNQQVHGITTNMVNRPEVPRYSSFTAFNLGSLSLCSVISVQFKLRLNTELKHGIHDSFNYAQRKEIILYLNFLVP